MRRQSILLWAAKLAVLVSLTLAFSPTGSVAPRGSLRRPTTSQQKLIPRPTPTTKRQRSTRQDHFQQLQRQTTSLLRSSPSENVNSENTTTTCCWSPKLRKVMGGLAALGALETAYLTVTELQGNVPALLCSTITEQQATSATAAVASSSSCSSVLTGPYAQIPGTEIPLAALGFVAYTTTLALAVGPLLMNFNKQDADDTNNRVLLTAVTTTMGVFSVFLMSLLFGVLHQSCPYCVASAVCSILLAKLAWIGGALPSKEGKRGIQLSAAGGVLSLVAVLTLFVANYEPPDAVLANIGNRASQSLLASTAPRPVGAASTDAAGSTTSTNLPPYAPPAITTTSSPEALQLADALKSLDASFYGAFWCSHCYDQKQTLGQQAMAKIPYVECSRDGLNANMALCKSKNVPGYPTWEIAGQLYPGEQALDELQEIVTKAKAAGRLQQD